MAKKTTNQAAPKLPTTIYVRWAGDEPDAYLDASEDVAAGAEVGEVRTVGVYKLERTGTLTVKPEFK